MSKLDIVVYFIVSAAVVVAYSLGVVPRLGRRGYPAGALRGTTAAVPAGTLLVLYGADRPVLLYIGAAVMLATTTSVPQVFGRVAAMHSADPGAVVFRLRQTMVAGFILGLGVYSAASFVRVEPLLVGSGFAAICAFTAWSRYFSGAIGEPTNNGANPSSKHTRTVAAALVAGAILVVALMKGVDTLRAIYLPLYATQVGISNEAIAPLFIVTAVTELLLLPVLRKVTLKLGEFATLAVICAIAVVAFLMLFALRGYGTILASQVLYAAFAAGFQSIGVVVLARVTGKDIGQGAAIFMTVIQTGSVLGAVLPLTVPGYQSGIFVIAAALCLLSAAVCLALRRGESVRPSPGGSASL
ncbi:hypothetical protein KK103_08055 [Curtobacterium flaccumfaciens pv. flaccumfaciens]|uniref:MFS transporter n=1 Tax=Curtobacterium flaccumfaciens pv. flaccumfaciens TaxID=138532 RepID=A0A9Q2W5J0_9MICO|nr:hypothetical protein [Curtobacterium flaccumfaciens]MBT1541709.1 hypothetical protein [Curtobacterium flaccumfaciens pv. flaccumfaciens]